MNATATPPGSRPKTARMNSSPGIETPSGRESVGAEPNDPADRASHVNGPTVSGLNGPSFTTSASSVPPSAARAISSARDRASGRASTIRQARSTSARAAWNEGTNSG